MKIINRQQKILLIIMAVNFVSTWLHYTDNALFLDQYPGPDWFTTPGVFATIILMTPVGLWGYWLYTKNLFWLSYLALGLYSITSISSPGHYLFPMNHEMSLKMHGLIWSDGISGFSLIAFILWSVIVAQEWDKTSEIDTFS
jgi:hypothetical protein